MWLFPSFSCVYFNPTSAAGNIKPIIPYVPAELNLNRKKHIYFKMQFTISPVFHSLEKRTTFPNYCQVKSYMCMQRITSSIFFVAISAASQFPRREVSMVYFVYSRESMSVLEQDLDGII